MNEFFQVKTTNYWIVNTKIWIEVGCCKLLCMATVSNNVAFSGRHCNFATEYSYSSFNNEIKMLAARNALSLTKSLAGSNGFQLRTSVISGPPRVKVPSAVSIVSPILFSLFTFYKWAVNFFSGYAWKTNGNVGYCRRNWVLESSWLWELFQFLLGSYCTSENTREV